MTVEPIRNAGQIKRMINYLRCSNERDYVLFLFGINTGLRIGDVIGLKFSDLFIDKIIFREYLVVKEQKTKKQKKIKINNALRNALQSYVRKWSLSGSDFLFPSKKGNHISRIQAYRILKTAATKSEIENFGTHSMRKTWGYHTYQRSRFNIGLIMDTFNHTSQSITLRYIGISQDQKDELYSMVQFG